MDTPLAIEGQLRPAVEFCCARCGELVRVCRSCWRNQKYCSEICSLESKRARHRQNQKAYRETAAGKENHKSHQRKYREQKKIQE